MRLAGFAAAAAVSAVLLAPARASADAHDLQALVDAAPAGSTIEVPAGTYDGSLRIDKPVRLVAVGEVTIDGGRKGSAVEVHAPDVSIEGFVIRGSGTSLNSMESGVKLLAPRARLVDNRIEDALFGVWLENSPDSYVADNVVVGKDLDLAVRGDGLRIFGCDRCRFERNAVHDTRDSVIWYSKNVEFVDNEVTGSRYGLHFMFADDTVVRDSRFTDNSVGVYVMNSKNIRIENSLMARNVGPSGDGLGLKDTDGFEATGNRILANRVGLYVDNSPTELGIHHYFRENMIAFNEIGLQFLPSVQRNVFTDNVITDNAKQVSVEGGGAFHGNDWSLDGRGNHWGDYAGFDSDGDGIGDVPYRIEDLFGTLTDREPALNLFTGTPASRAMDLAARAFPLLRPDPKVVDDAPLIHAPPIPPVRGAEERPRSAWALLVAVALVVAAAALVASSGAFAGPRRSRRKPVEAPA